MVNFIFKSQHNSFYVLTDNNNLYREEFPEFEDISIGVDKFELSKEQKFPEFKDISIGLDKSTSSKESNKNDDIKRNKICELEKIWKFIKY